MSNNINTLEAIENSVYTLKDIEGLNTEGLKAVYLIDLANKRRSKKSTPTLILTALEKYPASSKKDIENRLAGSPSKALKSNYETALAVRKAKGFNDISLRDYLRDRINKVFKYYLNSSIVKDIFSGLNPLIFTIDNKGIERYSLTLKLFPIAK